MDPNTLPPFGHISQIWLLAGETFIGDGVANCMGRATVLQPYDVVCCLCPKELWQARLKEKGLHMLHDSTIE